MLTQLTIQHFALIEHLELDLRRGMTVVTGETGAGKSIMLDALSLCLGDRADPGSVHPSAGRAEIHAVFDLADAPAAREWLRARELEIEGDECFLRRMISREGRSRAFINGAPSTLQDCSELGECLIDIHGQHAHQSLLHRRAQRTLLDGYAGCEALAEEVAVEARRWLEATEELERLRQEHETHAAQVQLLGYQVRELEELALEEGEFGSLEDELRALETGEQRLADARAAEELCSEQAAALRRALRALDTTRHPGAGLDNVRAMLDGAAIQVEEALVELSRYAERIDLDPERLREVQDRLGEINAAARRHRVVPERLPGLLADLRGELGALGDPDRRIEALQADADRARKRWRERSETLSRQRRSAARKLGGSVAATLERLAMGHCRFEASLKPRTDDAPAQGGREDVEFLLSTNPSSPPQPLGKIASGGELSRIGLAIQVAAASEAAVPTMIFDEVDSGIGGAVAEIVGRLLHTLAANRQVLCVTHLAQVAARADHHLCVRKDVSRPDGLSTKTQWLATEERVEELARMLGGKRTTERSREHAREMLLDKEAG